MDWSKKTFNRWGSCSLAALATMAMTACEVNNEEQQALEESFANYSDEAPPLPEVGPGCFVERHRQPEGEINRKIDVLFVVDTSSSLDEERAEIAKGVEAFVNALPKNVDYQIGVLLAHGPRGPDKGRLWKYNNDPHVLSSSSMSIEDIRTHLHTKMSNVRRDKHSDGGEMGLYSLNHSMREGKLDSMRDHGFYREDAGLAVIFVADENDICAQYPEAVTPVSDPQGIENEVLARDCEGITPENVLANLRALQGERPLFVGGALYTDRQTYPKSGENEIGYGYRDLIRAANGLAIDLANPHYHEGLGRLGMLAAVQLKLVREFPLANSGAEPSSVQTYVDGAAVPHLFIPELNEAHLTDYAGRSKSYVDVTYCPQQQEEPLVSEICSAGEFSPKGSVSLGVSMDPNSGLTSLFTSGFASMGLSPKFYTDAEVAAGKPAADGVNVMFVSRKIILSPVSQGYVDGMIDFIASGGSLVGEYDGAALMFSEFTGHHSTIVNFDPAFRLFAGLIDGGGVLLPLESSRTFVTDAYHPIMEGVPPDFLFGLRAAYAVTEYDGEWLAQSATFTSTGALQQVPVGTYPAVVSGRCGSGRVALFMMNYMNSVSQAPVKRMIDNALRWSVGQQ